MTVALDSNVFIVFLAQDAEFFEPAAHLLRQVAAATIKASYSSLVFGEVMRLPTRKPLKFLENFFRDLGGVDYPADRGICIRAAELRRRYAGLKLPDAIHLATALAAKAGQFVTADRQLAAIAKQEIATLYLKEGR